MKLKLIWAPDFHKRFKRQFSEAQSYVDREAAENMKKYVPVALKSFPNSGKLQRSVSNPEPGRIVQKGVNIRKEYLLHDRHFMTANSRATARWFETMKAFHLKQILSKAAVISGGKPKK